MVEFFDSLLENDYKFLVGNSFDWSSKSADKFLGFEKEI
jgi:hypothetical protein